MTTENFHHLFQQQARERSHSMPTTGSGLEHELSEHERFILNGVPISPGNHGIQALGSLLDSLYELPQNKNEPIVLVSGFSGWGRPLFGTINYWGGFEDLPEVLGQAGYVVIVVRIGPVSSNRERACEIWRQLTNINKGGHNGYDLPTDAPTRLKPMNYGNEHPAANLGFLQEAFTWKSVVFGQIPDGWNWIWGSEVPAHFICHSQGGNSVRYLIELLTGTHTDLFPGPDFPIHDCQDWVKSVVTIGTPHKGTTVTDVVQDLLPPNFLEVLSRLIWSTSFAPPESRFYDLQLDHWGFCRQENESTSAMNSRLLRVVSFWWNSGYHGLHDNSILGITELNDFAPQPSPHTYYFTMSFCATNPFPDRHLNQQDINDFLSLFPFNGASNPFGWWGLTLQTVFDIFSRLPFLPHLKDFAVWFTDVANRHLRDMNYFSRIPRPGNQVPRPDMLPVIAPSGFAMGGFRLDEQRLQALNGITSEQYQRNDGIVNTMSMSGPVHGPYGEGRFPGNNVVDMTRARKKYWHLGENATIDHADQVGVFTAANTAKEVSFMYLLFAGLITRLK